MSGSDDQHILTEPPIRVCCGQRHAGPICPDGLVMCCLCFHRFPKEDLRVLDDDIYEDVCLSCAAAEAAVLGRRKGSGVTKYEIPDPWPARVREALGRLACRVIDHQWRRKMHGQICDRCSIYRPD